MLPKKRLGPEGQKGGDKMRYTTIIRLFFTLALCYGVYTETGKFTALTVLLISSAIEIMRFNKEIR